MKSCLKFSSFIQSEMMNFYQGVSITIHKSNFNINILSKNLQNTEKESYWKVLLMEVNSFDLLDKIKV